MARITVEDCLAHDDTRFELVMVSSKRARQLQIEGKDPMVAIDNDKPTVIALREIADGLVNAEILVENPASEIGEEFGALEEASTETSVQEEQPASEG